VKKHRAIVQTILRQYPDTQAVYLFGSWGTGDEWAHSDVDIAVLLPVRTAKNVNCEQWIGLASEIGQALRRENVDLINLRRVNTVFQKEIIAANRRIFCADEAAADQFEMLTLSLYQQLQEERKEIIEDAVASGRFRHA